MQPACLRSSSRGRWRALAVGGAVVLAAGCFTDNEGQSPPPDAIYYPTGLILSPGGTTLFVTNSDFDLQYNGGTILALDLTKLRERLKPLSDALAANTDLKAACGAFLGVDPLTKPVLNHSAILFPGPCEQLDISNAANKGANPFVKKVATTG